MPSTCEHEVSVIEDVRLPDTPGIHTRRTKRSLSEGPSAFELAAESSFVVSRLASMGPSDCHSSLGAPAAEWLAGGEPGGLSHGRLERSQPESRELTSRGKFSRSPSDRHPVSDGASSVASCGNKVRVTCPWVTSPLLRKGPLGESPSP